MRSVFLLLLMACGAPNAIERDAFASFFAEKFCDRLERCARGDFERDYFGKRDCIAHLEREFELVDRAFDDLGCEYDPEGASDAWHELADMSCEDFYDAEYVDDYDKVWDCT